MRTIYESTSPILLLLILVLAAPPIEELFFRGFVIGGLESSGVSPMAAALVSSLAWAAIHLQYDFYGMQTIFVSGLLLAWARCKTGSIIPCVVMHGLANAVSFAETAILSRQAIV
jgi:membrane protease YdiL (CAAX protease family)